jgi:Tol biopolymer transport system component
MRNYYIIIAIIGLALFLAACDTQKNESNESDFPILKGPYLGQKPPGMKAEIFAPNIISTPFNEAICSFTPDGKEVFFRILGPPRGGIYFMKEVNGKWSEPQIASFLGNYDAKCNLSPDGNKIVFSTGMPLERKGKSLDHWEIWIVERKDSGWSTPVNLGHPVNSQEYSLICPTIANSGNIYFYSATKSGGFGKGDIWMSEFKNGQYSDLFNLGSTINTEFWENDPFISPDESYLIFQSTREGNHEFGDLFISFKDKNGKWTEPINMGENVNASYSGEGCPMVSPDGKYFFFSGGKINYKKYIDKPVSYKDKIQILSNPGNMSEDIFWIDAKIIEKLKPMELQ